ncbi:MAG TPA: hypothetical protein DEP28_09550 [Bacteroidetes bacterium]|nr:hypothetical protein [Bacteroidota bacterium]
MNNIRIIALVDYKNKFGSKHFDNPYRSGMDKDLLSKLFEEHGYNIEFEYFHKVDLRNVENYRGVYIIYTSSEDIGYHYKSYIEDIVFGLEQIGAILIPEYKHLRANNNKVFMEFLRTSLLQESDFYSKHFGSLKDLLLDIKNITYPVVLKTAEGASGTGVFLVKDENQLIKFIKKIKDYNYLKEDIKDFFRPYLHKGYQRESRYRNKFIIQPFIPNLKNDWKVYVFGEKVYVFNRPIQKGRGIKASGGGYDNYFYGKEANIPDGLIDFAQHIFDKLQVPHASLDIAYNGHSFYLIEFQTLYFGTAGIPYSNGHYKKQNNKWIFQEEKRNIEEVFVESYTWFLNDYYENPIRP